MKNDELDAATVERCAQVAERWRGEKRARRSWKAGPDHWGIFKSSYPARNIAYEKADVIIREAR